MRITRKYFEYVSQPNIRMRDLTLRAGRLSVRLMWRCPVDSVQVKFVRPTRYTQVFIVHPGGGGAARLKCTECGAEYPMIQNPQPCAFCAVEKESGVRVSRNVVKVWERTW